MAGRRTNLALLVALALALLTGLLAFSAGTGWGTGVVVIHGVSGLCIVVLAPWKSVIARRGLTKWRKGTWASLLFTVLVITSLGFGIAHSLGMSRPIGFVSAMQLHVGAALIALPLAFVHVQLRRVRPRRADLSRRSFIRGLGVLSGGAALYLAFESVSRMASFLGSERRFTGSHEKGSFAPDQMPVTQWLNDRVPSIDPDEWALVVRSDQGQKQWAYEELLQHADRMTATLDCTGGWFARQDWTGVPLSKLISASAVGRSIVVHSTTGYSRRFPIRDLGNLFLATGAGGAPLSPGHGFPARLVAPGRRGFWWVKWVDSIALDDRPWWTQLPFPAD